MGDRANFGFRQTDGSVIYLYGHWAGHEMMHRLADAIDIARPRWNDEMYATRIAISQLIGDEWDQEYSWGIANHIGDNEHSVPVVDWENKTVTLYPHTWEDGVMFDSPKFSMEFDAFVKRFRKMLTFS